VKNQAVRLRQAEAPVLLVADRLLLHRHKFITKWIPTREVSVDAIQNPIRQSLTSRLRAKAAIPKWLYRPHFSKMFNLGALPPSATRKNKSKLKPEFFISKMNNRPQFL
jgi:hypothetical protein